MIIKASIEFAQKLTDQFLIPLTSFYYIGVPEEKLDEGKLVLSIKVRKNRKLISGRVIHVGYESGGHGHPGYEVLRFVPNDPKKLVLINNEIKRLELKGEPWTPNMHI